MKIRIGIDVGSTTIKFVLLDENQKCLYKSYERHKSMVRQMCFDKLLELAPYLKGNLCTISISGSAGMGIAHDADLPFVQEVFACRKAVESENPDCDAVIELGGEDAKMLFLKGISEERMNSTCAGGTGAFIDQMASLLNVDLKTLDELAQSATKLYPIASRCGVFAKTDMQALLNQGVEKSNLAKSIYQAVVEQCITGLAQGRKLQGKIVFLGGPLTFLKGLQDCFKKTLKLDDQHAVFPDNGLYYVAFGAALCSDRYPSISYEKIIEQCEKMAKKTHQISSTAPLFENEKQKQDFLKRHQANRIPTNDIQKYQGNAYLGIDAGSTTTKLVLIDENDHILYQAYANHQGNPLDYVKQQLMNIYELCGDRIRIAHSAVTGYGEDLLKHAFHIDLGIVETMAHYQAAKLFDPEVDFIIDIGGQDMKCFMIKNHMIDDIFLNEACSSGCGSFIETFAKSLGYSIAEFADLGMEAQHPCDLGSRCTVFMNSSVKQAQKNGALIQDIAAGLCRSVVKNALYKVIRIKDPKELGSHIIVQGGTFLNNTILRCFEQELGIQVIRPNIAHLMGCYGAAHLAKCQHEKTTSLLDFTSLKQFTHQSMATACQGCTNHCSLTINTFSDGSKHIAGNKCSKLLQQTNKEKLPNLYNYKLNLLNQYRESHSDGIKIGIPLVLNLFDLLPFWHTFFTSLGFNVILSKPSSKALYASAQSTIPSDTACFPAKLVHGHIQSLINQKVDAIFYPCMTYNIDERISDNHFNCPIVAYYPQVIKSNMDLEDIPFISPFICFDHEKKCCQNLQDALHKEGFFFSLKQIKEAYHQAFEAYHDVKQQLYLQTEKALEYAQKHHKETIVLASRPYHCDPFINHGIANMLNDLGFVLISEDALPLEPVHVDVLNQWTYHARMYHAAEFVAAHPHTQLIQFVSFGCGIDAITTDEIKAKLHQANKIYTQIKIDENDNLAAIKIRCRSLLMAIKEREDNEWNVSNLPKQ